jgi:threonine dehydrogenase-like Zn-dependent dehydrogenase
LGRTVDGAFAQYVKVPAKTVHPIPGNVTHDDAQSTTTLACVLHALKRINVCVGDNLAILGPGHVGLLFLQTIKSVAARVFVLGARKNKSVLFNAIIFINFRCLERLFQVFFCHWILLFQASHHESKRPSDTQKR